MRYNEWLMNIIRAAMKLSFPLEHRYRIFSSSGPSLLENRVKVHTVDWVSLRGQRRKGKKPYGFFLLPLAVWFFTLFFSLNFKSFCAISKRRTFWLRKKCRPISSEWFRLLVSFENYFRFVEEIFSKTSPNIILLRAC